MSCTIQHLPSTVANSNFSLSVYDVQQDQIINPLDKNTQNNDENNVNHQKTFKTIRIPKSQNFMAKEEITKYQHEKISELKKRIGEENLKKSPIFNDDFSMLRWLLGYDYKIDEILPKFEKSTSILRSMGLIDFVIDDPEKINNYLTNLTNTARYFPGGIMGYDSEGNVISMQMTGNSHPKSLVHCGRMSDIYRLTICETALIYQLIKLQEQKLCRKLGLRVIIDLDGFNSDHVNASGIKSYSNALKYLQIIFPDITRQVYVINAPTIVTAAYRFVKSILSEQSRQKVIFVGNDYKETLLREIGADYIYSKWGGKINPKLGDPETGLLRVGGQLSIALRYLPEKNCEHILEKEFLTLNVPARNRREIEIDVPENFYIHWFFLTNGEIDFGIIDTENVEIWPQFRITTEYVPEYGKIKCKTSKKCIVQFDNTFSTFFSKEIKYFIYVKKC